MSATERQYNVIAVNEKTGHKTVMNRTPVTHAEACAWVKKFSYHPKRRVQVEQI